MLLQIFNLSPSPYGKIFFSLLHGGAVFSLGFLPLSYEIKIIVIIFVIISLLKCFNFLSRWQRLVYFGNHTWRLYEKSGQVHDIDILNHTIRTDKLLIINFFDKKNQKNESLLIFAKQMPLDEFRRLCVCLLQN